MPDPFPVMPDLIGHLLRTGAGSWGRMDTKPQALLTPCRPWRQQCPSPREDAVALRS